jgi:hypothetical protein
MIVFGAKPITTARIPGFDGADVLCGKVHDLKADNLIGFRL